MKYTYSLFRNLLLTSSILAIFSPAKAQYCTSGLYSYGCYYSDYVNSVSTTGGSTNISNLNSGCASSYAGYSDYTSLNPVTVQVGSSFALTVVNNPTWSEWYSVYIDYNGDGDFVDAGESIYASTAKVAASGTMNGGPLTINVPSGATPGTTRMRVRCVYSPGPSSSACSYQYGGETEDYKVVLTPSCPAPNISAQPQNRLTCETASTNFSITATNTSTYQWQVNTGSAWANVSGSVYSGGTTNNLTLSNIPLSYNGYQYRCVATGACNNPVNSSPAFLTVNPGVAILSQTKNDSICEGANTTLNVTANGSATNYQWEMAVATVGVFSNVPNTAPFSGANSSALNITSVPSTYNGYLFKCTVTGGLCPSAVSENIPFTVLISPVFAEGPKNDTIVYGYSAHFSAKATLPDVVYYWQAAADGINYANINNNSLYSGVTTPNLEVFAGWPLANWWFRCVIKSTDPSCGLYRDTSDPAQLIILGPNSVNSVKDSKLNVTMYPNPASGSQIFVSTDHTIAGVLQSKIVDKLGRTLYNTELDLSKNKTAPVAVAQLPAGIYILQLTDAEGNTQNINFTRQ